MAKHERIPDTCSDYGNSSFTRKKWINLSSTLLSDGFAVPVTIISLPNLPFAEKNLLLLKLRVDLDKIRTFQKRFDLHRDHSVTKKLSASQNFSLELRKQCGKLLKKLMMHRYGWMFNKPVDIVEFNIPDYYDVIKNPMDLGTIKEKLDSGRYESPLDFLADVRLTFANAMTYNPPGNDVNVMADILLKFFEQRWKLSQVNVDEDTHLVKLVMSENEKHKLTRDLEVYLDNLPGNIIDFLREHALDGDEAREDEIVVDIDELNDDNLFKLRKMLDDYLQEKQNHIEAESCVIEVSNVSCSPFCT